MLPSSVKDQDAKPARGSRSKDSLRDPQAGKLPRPAAKTPDPSVLGKLPGRPELTPAEKRARLVAVIRAAKAAKSPAGEEDAVTSTKARIRWRHQKSRAQQRLPRGLVAEMSWELSFLAAEARRLAERTDRSVSQALSFSRRSSTKS
jgi:hypothetical protein